MIGDNILADYNSIITKINQIANTWNEKYLLLKEVGIQDSDIVSPNISLITINDKLLILSEILINLEIETKISSHIIFDYITKIDNNLDSINVSLTEIQTIISNINSNNGFKSYDSTTFQVTNNNDTPIVISTPFTNIFNYCNQIVPILSNILPYSKYRSIDDLVDRIHSYQGAINELLTIVDHLNQGKIIVDADVQLINGHKSAIEAIVSEIAKIKTDYAEEYKSIKDKSTETEAKIARIKEITATSQTLDETVNTYKSKFDTYTAQIDERLKKWDQIQSLLESSNKKNEEREKEIENLTKTSNDLIKGATISGLATSFKKQYDKYKWELVGARWSFYIAIFLLFLSVIPLVLYILPKEIVEHLPDVFKIPEALKVALKIDKAKNDINSFGVIVRFLILIPPTWLTRFSSRRYRELFILREEYAHKSTIAQSIYGFKKEAPKYEDEITAGVFLELNRKPNITHDKISIKDDKYENPIFELLRNLLSKAVDLFTKKETR